MRYTALVPLLPLLATTALARPFWPFTSDSDASLANIDAADVAAEDADLSANLRPVAGDIDPLNSYEYEYTGNPFQPLDPIEVKFEEPAAEDPIIIDEGLNEVEWTPSVGEEDGGDVVDAEGGEVAEEVNGGWSWPWASGEPTDSVDALDEAQEVVEGEDEGQVEQGEAESAQNQEDGGWIGQEYPATESNDDSSLESDSSSDSYLDIQPEDIEQAESGEAEYTDADADTAELALDQNEVGIIDGTETQAWSNVDDYVDVPTAEDETLEATEESNEEGADHGE